MKFILIVICVLLTTSARSQIELSASINYVMPLGELGDVFQNSPNYQIGFSKAKKYKKNRKSFGVSLGYLYMNPKQDTLLFDVETDNGLESGKIHFNPYKSYQIMYTSRFEHLFNNALAIFYGYDIGFHFTILKYYLEDPYTIEDSEEKLLRFAIIPKAGLSFSATKNLAISLQSQYLFTIGYASDSKNMVHQFFSVGASILVRLN